MFSSVCEGFSRTKPEFRRVVYWKCKPFKWKWKFYVKLFSQLSFCVQLRKKKYISQTMFWLLLIIFTLQFEEKIWGKKNAAGLAFYVVFWVHQQRPPAPSMCRGSWPHEGGHCLPCPPFPQNCCLYRDDIFSAECIWAGKTLQTTFAVRAAPRPACRRLCSAQDNTVEWEGGTDCSLTEILIPDKIWNNCRGSRGWGSTG